jgi:hypothetical protein
MISYLRRMTRDPNTSLYVLLSYVFEPSYRVGLGHLEDVLVDEKYLMAGDIMKYLGQRTRALGRSEILALSGNSGMGPIGNGWAQPPHLHFALYRWNEARRNIDDLDPDKYGIDGGRPVFWDGKTRLDARAGDRPALLEKMEEGPSSGTGKRDSTQRPRIGLLFWRRFSSILRRTSGNGEMGRMSMSSGAS